VSDTISNLREWADHYRGQPVSLTLDRAATELAEAREDCEVTSRIAEDMTQQRDSLKQQLDEARDIAADWAKENAQNVANLEKSIILAETLKQQSDRLAEALRVMVGRIEYYSNLPAEQRPSIEQWEYTNGSTDMTKARQALAELEGGKP